MVNIFLDNLTVGKVGQTVGFHLILWLSSIPWVKKHKRTIFLDILHKIPEIPTILEYVKNSVPMPA